MGIRLIVRLGAVLAISGLSACPQRTAVWVVQPATTTNLTFALGRVRGKEEPVRLYYLSISHCGSQGQAGQRPIWMIGERPAGPPATAVRIRYGEVPPGFEVRGPPGALAPGCYVADIGGSGTTEFDVGPTGAVTEHVRP